MNDFTADNQECRTYRFSGCVIVGIRLAFSHEAVKSNRILAVASIPVSYIGLKHK